jgi:DHA1 family multidrug resistance protein-like MFS transporter
MNEGPMEGALPEDASRISRATLAIAAGAGLASLSMNFWVPFLPLYVQELGADSPADALFWVAVAATAQGFARLAAGPIWGILSDRYGRKLMFLRALTFASVTTLIAAIATEPWHIAVAFVCQGIFSGFIPAAVALTSVTVPDSRLNSSLSTVTGAQYLGNTLGPAVGGALAVVVGYRGAIIGAAAMPALAAAIALVTVPRDRVGSTQDEDEGTPTTPSIVRPSIRSLLTAQFVLVLFVYFVVFSLNQVLRLATPVALEGIAGADGAAAASGVAFTVAGLTSVAGVVAAQRLVGPGRLQRTLAVCCAITGIAHFVLPFADFVTTFVAAFAVIAMLQAALVPATNTLIASNAPRERRGTAFGLASGVQALAFMVGPMAAAGFAAVSLDLGFVVIGALFVALAVLVLLTLREPAVDGR